MRTRQVVGVQQELLQCRAEAEFRRNVACTTRRLFLDVGTLVQQLIHQSKKVLTGQFVDTQQEARHCRAAAEFCRDVACAERRSVFDRGTLVYQTGPDEHKLTYQSICCPTAEGHS